MEIVKDIEKITESYHNAVITIGNFDGVHRGHQALLKKVIDKSKEINGTAVAITFVPHPARVLNHSTRPPLITMFEQKKELIARSGIDVLVCIPFTLDFAEITADHFLKEMLVGQIGMKAIVVGKDYTFGKDRDGNIEYLTENADDLGYEVIVADWEKIPGTSGERISSTKIREIITDGRVDEAVNLLGRPYQIRGKVITGRNRGGKVLGFPTANINLQDELSPKIGVYAVTVEWTGKTFKGVANIGYSPTFGDQMFTVEVHLLDFDEDIYEQDIRVNFIRRLRGEKKFAGIDELSNQIKKDIETAREILPG